MFLLSVRQLNGQLSDRLPRIGEVAEESIVTGLVVPLQLLRDLVVLGLGLRIRIAPELLGKPPLNLGQPPA